MKDDVEDAVRATLAKPPVPVKPSGSAAEFLAGVDSRVRGAVSRRWLLAGFGAAATAAAVSVPIVVLSGGGAGRHSALAPAGPSTISTLSDSQIKDIALATAKSYGDPSPTTITYVKSTRATALDQVTGVVEHDSSHGSDPVIVIVMTGHFTVTGLGLGNGSLTGSSAHIVLDAVTGQALNWGIAPNAPDITPLGKAVTLTP